MSWHMSNRHWRLLASSLNYGGIYAHFLLIHFCCCIWVLDIASYSIKIYIIWPLLYQVIDLLFDLYLILAIVLMYFELTIAFSLEMKANSSLVYAVRVERIESWSIKCLNRFSRLIMPKKYWTCLVSI